jgi:biotin carboxylase
LPNDGKHLLLIGGRDHTLDRVQLLGVRYSMVQVPDLVNPRQYLGASRYAVLDYTDLAELLPLVRAWHAIDPFHAVASFTEYGLEPASRCAIDLGVAGDNLAAVLVTRDKVATRQLLAQHNLSPVRYRSCADMADARDFLAQLAGRPMIVKPQDGGLSEGVSVVRNPIELADAWNWTRSATSGPVLAEEYLDGPEYSVESISLRGKHEIVSITEKLTTELPRFIEIGHSAPAVLSAAAVEQLTDLVTTFLELIGQRTAPAHTELRLTADGPRIIESQTRFGGDQIWEICELVTGVDLMTQVLAELLSLPQPPRRPRAPAAAIRFFCLEEVRVERVSGIADAEQAPGVVRISCSLRPGQVLTTLTSSNSRQGYVLCTGADPAEARVNADAAHDLVRVELKPVGIG